MNGERSDTITIADHVLIGNSRACALVSSNGSIDWCCLPEFHSPALFASILDSERGGCFSIMPAGRFSTRQDYVPDTNVSRIIFDTAGGSVRLLDAFVALTEEEKTKSLFPDHELLRVVECISGSVDMKLEYKPRIFYGKYPSSLSSVQQLGIQFSWKGCAYILHSTLPTARIRLNESRSEASLQFIISSGERVIFSLSCSEQAPEIIPELKTTGWERMLHTMAYWKNWIDRCRYKGKYAEAVKRSALVLKLLMHAPSGAIIAAPTTSLPEDPGGERNWDYRYCWLRDASFTVRALLQLGFEEEAQAYMAWIIHATRLTHPKLQVVYSVYGHAKLKEEELTWLQGYMNSKPVRTGNKASDQFQLDIYGEVLDAVAAYSSIMEELDRSTKKFVLGLGNIICSHWEQPDNGIWEARSAPLHYTHSKVMAWAGLNRLIFLCRKYKWKDAPVEKFSKTAALVRDRIEEQAYSKKYKTYTRELNGSSVDASLLVLPLVDYCKAAAPRMNGTISMIRKQLSENNLLYRYREISDGLSGREGSFGICTFWLAEVLARAGRREEAEAIFENVLKYANGGGLLSEEIDPASGVLLGNFPQGFTHIGLINTALSLERSVKDGEDHEY